MATTVHEKYAFDTVFDSHGQTTYAAPRPKRFYSHEEVDAIRASAHADGERQALESIHARIAGAMGSLRQEVGEALKSLSEVAYAHRVSCANLALACGQSIAGSALNAFPEAPLQAALAALATEVESVPRLVVSVAPDLAEALSEKLNETAQSIGYPGQIIVRSDPSRGPAAFTLDFGDGAASFDPQQASERVAETMQQALLAELSQGEIPHPVSRD